MIILDRDGVINRMVVDAEHGTVNSPLHPSQVELLPGAAEAIVRLNQFGFQVSIATNQPAAAKGTTTKANLDAVHVRVLEIIKTAGGNIISSHICFHKAEDRCACRKPATGLLEEALKTISPDERRETWMVGDGVTDIQAGQRLELKTAYIGPKRSDHLNALAEKDARPTEFFDSLKDFAQWLCSQKGSAT